MSEPIRSISQNNYLLAAQQEVSHDNTLSGNGTEASPLGLNETVLWNGNGTPATSATLSESMTNFETVKIYFINTDREVVIREIDPSVQGSFITQEISTLSTEPKYYCKVARFGISGNTISRSYQAAYTIGSTGVGSWNTTYDTVKILKVVGINRKSST